MGTAGARASKRASERASAPIAAVRRHRIERASERASECQVAIGREGDRLTERSGVEWSEASQRQLLWCVVHSSFVP